MKIDHFLEFINKNSMYQEFVNYLKPDVLEYTKARQENKGTLIIYGEYNEDIYFTNDKMILVLNTYLDGYINEWALEYLLNYIEFCFSNIESESEEIIALFSTPEIGFDIAKNRIQAAIDYLDNKTNTLSW